MYLDHSENTFFGKFIFISKNHFNKLLMLKLSKENYKGNLVYYIINLYKYCQQIFFICLILLIKSYNFILYKEKVILLVS